MPGSFTFNLLTSRLTREGVLSLSALDIELDSSSRADSSNRSAQEDVTSVWRTPTAWDHRLFPMRSVRITLGVRLLKKEF